MLTPETISKMQAQIKDLDAKIRETIVVMSADSYDFGTNAAVGNFDKTEELRERILSRQGEILDTICAKAKILLAIRRG